MEGFTRIIFRDLLGTEWEVATAIFASMGTKQMMDVLMALGAIRLNEVGAKRLKGLCERLGKQNTKRNSIVHGTWVATVIIDDHDATQMKITTTWVRTYTPVQYEKAKHAGRYDLPGIGETSSFTIPQMQTAAKQVATLMGDLANFHECIPSLRKPVPPSP
jgi:hypothetical protein